MGIEPYFENYDESRRIFDAVRRAIDDIGKSEIRVGKSQISFRRRRVFAWLWIPGKALRRQATPLVLTLGFRHRDPSPRWKEIVEPAPGRFTHHLELTTVDDIDAEVHGWLREAWTSAG